MADDKNKAKEGKAKDKGSKEGDKAPKEAKPKSESRWVGRQAGWKPATRCSGI
jgi:hypothetical protein